MHPIEKQIQDYIDETYDRMKDEKDLEGLDDNN